MPSGDSRYIKRIFLTGDLILLNLSFLVYFYSSDQRSGLTAFHFTVLVLFLTGTWFITFLTINFKELRPENRVRLPAGKLILTIVLHFSLLLLSGYLFPDFFRLIPSFFLSYLLFLILLLLWRPGTMVCLKYLRKKGWHVRRVMLIGADERKEQLLNYFNQHPEEGYRMVASVPSRPEAGRPSQRELLEEACSLAMQHKPDEIILFRAGMEHGLLKELQQFTDRHMIRLRMVPEDRESWRLDLPVQYYLSLPVVSLRKEPLESALNQVIKRIFDILFSLLIIVCIFPWLGVLIAILIKLSSPGPVFFRQLRSGKGNRQFLCYKFRTMKVNPEADEVQASKNDRRITSVGRLLRKTSLDELPQFFNVLAGSMSVVGPRPHMLRQTAEYSMMIDNFMVRHLVKPGVTGWAQIWGFRGVTSDPLLLHKKVDHDIWYLENWSLLLDIKIVFYTIFNMIRGEENAG